MESCRSLEVLKIQVVTDLSFHLQWQENDGYITRLHAGVLGCEIGPGKCLHSHQTLWPGLHSHPNNRFHVRTLIKFHPRNLKKTEVRVQRAQVISIGNLPIREPKGRDAHDVQTTVYTEARGCPLSASCFRPITRALGLK